MHVRDFGSPRVRPRHAAWWDAARQDVTFALRALRRTPGFTAAVVVTLALGIGANAALFSLADRLFLRPPSGITDPSSVRRLYVRSNWSVGAVTVIRAEFSYRAFDALAGSLVPRARLAAYTPPDSVSLASGDGAASARAVYVTAAYFPLLGVRPALGRFFVGDDDRMGAGARVAVLSHALWQRRFAGDRAIIGHDLQIAGQPYTVIGVAPATFTGADLDAAEVWMPLATFPAPPIGNTPWYRSWRSGFDVRVLARVAPGTPDAWLTAVGTTALRRGELAGVSAGPDTSATVLPGPLLESLGPSIQPAPEVAIATRLVGIVFIVLVIACANVANLLLARALGRRREIAVRLALGISRRRLVAQLLIESLVLALAGAAAALAVGAWGGAALRTMMMPTTHWAGPPLDGRVILFTVGVALLTGIAAGLAPALRASRPDLTNALKAGGREGTVQRSALRTTLLITQTALAVVLLAGAGLFVQSLRRVHAIDLGYDVERLVFASVQFVNPQGHYVERFAGEHRAELTAGLQEAAARLAQRPDVERTALASAAPMRGYAMIGMYFAGGAPVPRPNQRDPALIAVSPSYFAATGMRLARGRGVTEADRAGASPVLVVNETLARTYWPGREALGQCLILFRLTDPCRIIVGITKDAHLGTVVEQPLVQLYAPLAQDGGSPGVLILRTAPEHAARVAEETRRELRRLFPTAEFPQVTPMAVALEPQLRPWRLGASLFTAFGVLALLVAALGVYSVIAYSVGQRTHEMGVRVALGAEPLHLVRLVVGQGVRTVLAGVVLGTALALGLGRFVASMLYGTSTRDPLVLAAVAALLLAAAALASLVPAWRASRADPMVALRAE